MRSCIQSGDRVGIPLETPTTAHVPTDIAIANSLGNLCRFTGHVKKFYSVAEHSVLLSLLVRRLGGPRLAAQFALVHDVQECILSDLSTPLKKLDALKGYRYLEHDWQLAVLYRFFETLPPQEICQQVMALDSELGIVEAQLLLPGGINPDVWGAEAAAFDPPWKSWVRAAMGPLAPEDAGVLWHLAHQDLFQ